MQAPDAPFPARAALCGFSAIPPAGSSDAGQKIKGMLNRVTD
jgi:hypothetical protein